MNEKLISYNEKLKNSKVAVIGAGVSNIPLLEYLINLKSNVTLFDKKEFNDLSDEVKSLIDKNNLKTFLGEDYLEHLQGFDIVFRSPSCLPTNPYLEDAKKNGAIITTEVEEVIRMAPGKVIGITGSKGKTTTTTILYNLLKEMGYSVFLGGNIGIPLFSRLKEMTDKDIIVLELSSFQLFKMQVSPDIAVVTNISPDHLDIHKDYNEYIEAKKYIYVNQDKDSILVLNYDDDIVREFAKEAKGEVRYFSSSSSSKLKNCYLLDDDYIVYNDKKIINTKKLLLKGKHNYLNVCCALNAIKDYINVDKSKLEDIVKKIGAVKHRLEFVREINGVKWYNDSASTTPDKCIAGILAFDEKVVLIAGGSDKNISYKPLADIIVKKVSKLILFGSTKEKIYNEVMKLKSNDVQIFVMDTLDEVIEVAYRVSEPGEVVLFSPASASFDMFNNAYERGDLFKLKVNEL